MTLPSNASMSIYPDNTLTRYKTKLKQMCELNGQWEVGLAEIQFPKTWYNLSEKAPGKLPHLTVMFPSGYQNVGRYFVDISPPAGHYDNPEMLIKQINDRINETVKKGCDKIKFTFNNISRKVGVKCESDKKIPPPVSYLWHFKMSVELAEVLGFEWSMGADGETFTQSASGVYPEMTDDEEAIPIASYLHFVIHDEEYECNRVCDLQRGFYSLFVYCDICDHVIVGDSLAPLLRTVNLDLSKSVYTMQCKTYQTIQYVPVQTNSFESLEIDIRDDSGHHVPFQRGKVFVTLHFRRVQR